MSLSKYLQSPEVLHGIPGKEPEELQSYIYDKCSTWYAEHPEESELIRRNLQRLDIAPSDKLLEDIQRHVFLHYCEKFLAIYKSPEEYSNFLKNSVDLQDTVKVLRDALLKGNGILITAAHFGAIEFLIPSISMYQLPLNAAIRFATEQFSKRTYAHAEKMKNSGFFSQVNLIEIGKPGTIAALDMAAVLRKKEILFTVFDEKTDYSIPVKLFGKEVWGGAGLDRLIQFIKTPVSVFTAFMVRTGKDSYQLKLIEVDRSSDNIIQSMFINLEEVVNENLAQWYFLHEEIPFLDK